MNVTAVESSTLATIAYDTTRELLQLEFNSRALYQYFGVPATQPAETRSGGSREFVPEDAVQLLKNPRAE
jgi:hypothetical protein